MGLLKTILYAIIIYYIWNIIRTLFRNQIPAMPPTGKTEHKQKQTQTQRPVQSSRNTDGEYVDYEEIK
jgi:hypothetical protein